LRRASNSPVGVASSSWLDSNFPHLNIQICVQVDSAAMLINVKLKCDLK